MTARLPFEIFVYVIVTALDMFPMITLLYSALRTVNKEKCWF